MVRTTSAEHLAELAADSGIVNDLGAVSRRLQTALKGTTWFGHARGLLVALGRLLLAGVRHQRGTAAVLRRPRRARRRPPQGFVGPRRPAHRRRPAVHRGLLPPAPRRQRLAAGERRRLHAPLAGPRRHGRRAHRRSRRRQRQGARLARPTSVASRCTSSTPTSPATRPEGVAVTDRLYGGDEHHRLRQEIILGIGGVRALRALGLAPDVFHTNEGHAGFLGLERVREFVGQGLPFDAAVEVVRGGGVFTTHTPVPAGIDRFPRALLEPYFTAFAADCGVTFDELFAIGVHDDEPLPSGEAPKFNMAVMGLRLAARSNGVARLHGAVSRLMFRGLWPDLAVDEVPIGAVTNGVHGRTWVSPRVDALLSRVVGEDWPGADADALGPRPRHRPPGSVGDDQQRPRRPRTSRPPTPRSGRPRSDRADGRLRPPLRDLQAGDAAALRRRSPLRPAVRQRASRAVRLRRQGPPGGHARQGADPAHRAVRSRRRRSTPVRLPRRLRHLDRPGDVPRLRRVAEHAAPAARGLRHERHEGRR